ncbi:fimbrillin family protein [Bacteroides caecigallinarum]|uniref:fimbrillin family protein n=1 Tax=Bacteroides caecigallinarum TaxID=1411144 RepID=UPI00195EE0A7|nr:fimbrillin family protein [Bacteroides caecigallinarum]MBM6864548.1 fimbrillin family protein [Bacteroides caecigallinarum]
MKKNLILMGAAIAALSSCTQSEVLDVPESKAIRFSSFVDKPTRTVTEVTNLTNFYVFGNFGTDDSYGNTAYNNESNAQTYYWAATGNKYRFGAYANGENGKLTSTTQVSFSPTAGTDGTLTFTNYAPQENEGKDLVAAIPTTYTVKGNENGETKVDLTFKHLLSQVKFTFKTTDADTYTLKIHDIKIDNNAISKANCTFDGTNIAWATEGVEKNGYTYDEIADIAVATALDGENAPYQGSSVEMVIPQSGTNNIKVTFSATVSGGGFAESKTGNFEANLDYAVGSVTGTTANTWTPGYRYNYIATINADQIDETLETKKINFTATVEKWNDANETDKGELNKQPGA